MTSHHYTLDPTSRTLEPLRPETMQNLGLTEPGDLEAWIASCRGRIFDRGILWVSRQDWVEVDRRSDLVGVDTDANLVITELKRGEVAPEAVFQVLNYAASYSRHGADDLQRMLLESTGGPQGLTLPVASDLEARDLITSHVGQAFGAINQRQVALLVGESFHPQTLRICQYLNSQGCRSLSIECWQFSIFPLDHRFHFVLKRAEAPQTSDLPVTGPAGSSGPEGSAQTSRLNPVKMKFREQFIEFIRTQGAEWGFEYEHKRGWPNYTFRLVRRSPRGAETLEFTARHDHPRFEASRPFRVPDDLASLVESGADGATYYLVFPHTLLLNHLFDPSTGRRLLGCLAQALEHV
jgi:hypothetical protein